MAHFDRAGLSADSGAARLLLEEIAAHARDLGIERLGVADPAQRPDGALYDDWLARGDHAGMAYLARRRAERLDPHGFFPGVRSILCVATNYYRGRDCEAGSTRPHLRIARYAWGHDYHQGLRGKLEQLLAGIAARVPGVRGRVAVDTSPVLERHWAARAGVGWIGRSGALVVPGLGSWVFLGEIFLDVPLPTGAALASRCGSCRRCVEACPGGALAPDRPLDARRCIAYWTIEHRGAFPRSGLPPLAPWLFGCDICQEVCPWNRAAPQTQEPAADEILCARGWAPEDWERLGAEGFAQRFGETALARAGYGGILRNLHGTAAPAGQEG